MSLDVETVKIDNLRPYHRNPRSHTHSKEHVQESIEKFGFRIPVVLDSENTIVAGHGRFKAVQKLSGQLGDRIEELRDKGRDALAENLEVIHNGEIYAIYDEDLESQEISEFRVADNRITELSNWDDDLLQQELETLDTESEDPVGFDEDELADLVPDYEIEIDDEPDDDDDDDDSGGFTMPDEGGTGVELVCPDCLEEFELSVEAVKMELEMMTDDEDENEEAEAEA